MEFKHKTVLLPETISKLNINPDGVYVDATAGGGGCSEQIALRLSDKGRLICIDQDPDAIECCKNRLGKYENVTIVKANFSTMKSVVQDLGIECVDGVVMDIGVSSHQLDEVERGFSYKNDAVLDMRMSQDGKTARDLVNELSADELSRLIHNYGEDKCASRIARAIVKARDNAPINTTLELAEIISNAVPGAVRREGHPARKTFQALRICVNDELGNLSRGLNEAFSILKSGGRLAVITFHSLEDKIVKNQMYEWKKGCECPPDFPICVCGKKPRAKIVCKPIVPSKQEIEENPRSRSSKLRVCEKL